MLKTSEIPNPLITDTTSSSSDGRYMLYEAFRTLTDPKYVKEFHKWRRGRSRRWIGGITSPCETENLSNDPISVLLRESKGVVQLVVVNRDAWEMDQAKILQEGWDFPDTDDSVILDAKFIKGGKFKGKTFITYNDPTSVDPETTDPQSALFDETSTTISLTHQLAFEKTLKVLLGTRTRSYPCAQLITSPLWRNYDLVEDRGIRHIGGLRIKQTFPEGMTKI